MLTWQGTGQVYSIDLDSWRGKTVWRVFLLLSPIPEWGEPFEAVEFTYFPTQEDKDDPITVGSVIEVQGQIASMVGVSSANQTIYKKVVLRASKYSKFLVGNININIEKHVRAVGSNHKSLESVHND